MAKSFISEELELRVKKSESDFFEIINSEHNTTKIISFVNPFSYPIVSRSPLILDLVDYWFVDGSALCYLSNLRRSENVSRVSFDFSSVANVFFEYASDNQMNVGLIGSTEQEIVKAVENIQKLYPRLSIVYSHHGYIKENYQKVCTEIDNVNVDLLLVGMGTPMQEEFSIFCKENSHSLKAVVTCGGFLTQTSIKSDYYHPLVKRLGLRWAQRALLHQHVRNRLIRDYPVFIIRYLLNR